MSDFGVQSTRRGLLKGAVLPGAVLAGCATSGDDPAAPAHVGQITASLNAYAAFGAKNAGGPGDTASGGWIEQQLGALGYTTAREMVRALTIDARDPELAAGGETATLTVHRIGREGAFDALEGPLVVWGAHAPPGPANGAIVIAHLPRQRWSSERQSDIRALTSRAFQNGAAALVLVTNGPTREVIPLNRTLAAPAHGPVALMAPGNWQDINWQGIANAGGGRARMRLSACEAPRDAYNVIARLDRGRSRWIVVSTPRSGWGPCVGERGPGIAIFLALADWARRFSSFNLAFVSASSHEFENAGAEAFLEHGAPAPQDVALWLHLGAGFAARDWHEAGDRLLPLPSADPQRYLMTSPALVPSARAAFAGLSGLEAAYSTDDGGAGELQSIVAAGYPRVAGMFGAHRFHHTASDDLRCVAPEHCAAVLERLKRALPIWLELA